MSSYPRRPPQSRERKHLSARKVHLPANEFKGRQEMLLMLCCRTRLCVFGVVSPSLKG